MTKGSVVVLNIRYKQNDRKLDLDHYANELLGQLQKDVPIEDLSVNNSVLNGSKTKSITYNVLESINMVRITKHLDALKTRLSFDIEPRTNHDNKIN